MRKLWIFVCLIAPVVLAQSRARDAGVAVPKPARGGVDAGVPEPVRPNAPPPEVEKLRKELGELKLRLAEVERQQQAKTDALDGELDKLSKKLDELKGQLKDVSAAEERRADAEQAVATRKAQTAQGSASVNTVLQQLASGNTNGVDASLRYAESVFTGNAQRDIQLARAALQQGDVAAARQYLGLALFEAEVQR